MSHSATNLVVYNPVTLYYDQLISNNIDKDYKCDIWDQIFYLWLCFIKDTYNRDLHAKSQVWTLKTGQMTAIFMFHRFFPIFVTEDFFKFWNGRKSVNFCPIELLFFANILILIAHW